MNPAETSLAAAETSELSRVEWNNARVMGNARLVVLSLALAFAMAEPGGPARTTLLAVFALYGAYSVLQRLRIGRGVVDNFCRAAHYVDVACYALAIALTGGLESRLVTFILLPVAAVSFQCGLRRGVQIAVSCTAAFAGIDVVQAAFEPGAQAFPVSPASLLLLLSISLMVARWAQAEVGLVRRVAFTNDLNRLCSPHNNPSLAVHALAENMRGYHRANACIVILEGAQPDDWRLYRTDDRKSGTPQGERIGASLARTLLAVPEDRASLFVRGIFPWQSPRCFSYPADSEDGSTKPLLGLDALNEAAHLLETPSFISVPVRSRNRAIGRLFLCASHHRLGREALQFLWQVAGQAGSMIENLQLLERLSSQAASEERKRISRDLHDGTVQPYIGLKLGLEALSRRIPASDAAAREVEELIRMATDGISELRCYVGGLKDTGAAKQAAFLLPAIRLQAEKFSDYYGIDAKVIAERDIAVQPALFDDVIHIVREGLFNIRRHTAATRAVIELVQRGDRLVLAFINDMATANAPAFSPRSIGERARDLGGRVTVERRRDRHTAVTVELPL